jgi:hypothetical protein
VPFGPIFALGLWIFGFILVVCAVVDILRQEKFTELEKLIWVLIVIFLNIIGVIVYYFVGRTKAIDLEKVRSEISSNAQYCPYCSKKIDKSFTYCPYCGGRIIK